MKIKLLRDFHGLLKGDVVEAQERSSLNEHYLAVVTGAGELAIYSNEYQVVVESTSSGGMKFDNGKPDLSMVSFELVDLLAQVRMFGAKKYDRDNWKKGFKVTRSTAAALRHIFQFLSGETHDSESGLLHLGHAVAALEHAIYDMKHHPENDDRYKGDK